MGCIQRSTVQLSIYVEIVISVGYPWTDTQYATFSSVKTINKVDFSNPKSFCLKDKDGHRLNYAMLGTTCKTRNILTHTASIPVVDSDLSQIFVISSSPGNGSPGGNALQPYDMRLLSTEASPGIGYPQEEYLYDGYGKISAYGRAYRKAVDEERNYIGKDALGRDIILSPAVPRYDFKCIYYDYDLQDSVYMTYSFPYDRTGAPYITSGDDAVWAGRNGQTPTPGFFGPDASVYIRSTRRFTITL